MGTVVVALGVLLAGCAERPVDPAPAESPSPSATPSAPPTTAAPPSADQGPIGMDIRYLDADGRTKVLRVEDFPR